MAGGKGNTTSADFLKAWYQATATANIVDNAATSPLTNLYVALATGTLTAASSQTTNEAAYTGPYARVAVVRTSSGWSVSSQTVSNVAAITFPTCTGGSETETYFSVGTASSGTGKVLHWAPLTASLAVSNGITPSFAIGALTVTES